MQLCVELQPGWTANRNCPWGGGQEFNHCDKYGRGRVPSVPLRMRQTHWLNSRLSSLNSWSSLFYFYFTLSSSFLFGFHYPVLSLFLCCFHSSNPPLFKLLLSKWPVTPCADGWVPVCAHFGAPFNSCNMNWHVNKQVCQCAHCPHYLSWKRAEIVNSHIFWQAQCTEQQAGVTTGYGYDSDTRSIVGASLRGLRIIQAVATGRTLSSRHAALQGLRIIQAVAQLAQLV